MKKDIIEKLKVVFSCSSYKNSASRYYKKILAALKKHWLLFALIFELWLTQFIIEYLLIIGPFYFLWLLVVYTLWLTTFYIFFQKSSSNFLEKHQAFLAVLAIIFPITLFFLQDSIQTIQSYRKYEVSLKEENNRNYSHLQSIINDLSKNPYTVFWRDFSLRSYVELWDYIHLNKSQDCKDLYATLTIKLGILNNINRMRQELTLVPNNLYEAMLDEASSTKPILDKIIGQCQSL